MTTNYLACDLGAESGRLMLGQLNDSGVLRLKELHRFANTPVKQGDSLTWNIAGLYAELKHGLKKAASLGLEISSLSTDSWGVDYVLFDDRGEVISPTYNYRDERCAGGVQAAYQKTDWPRVFAETGIQFLAFNTLFQLAAEAPERLRQAHQWLGVGDAFNFMLSGIARAEASLASTSQLYNPLTGNWSEPLIDALGFPRGLFPPIVPSGTRLGPLNECLLVESGLAGIEVVASCSHDTGAAVAAVPARNGHWAYLSSGTWSLMGVELDHPVVTETCRDLNFTNEIGHGNSVRLLTNIIGLWLVQECRRAWAAAGSHYDYEQLMRMAQAAPPFKFMINPADERFLPPDDMPARITSFCKENDQPVPDSPGEFIRGILECLAFLYGQKMTEIERITGQRWDRLHIVGGGSKNTLLNQFTANSLKIPVICGPSEATAMGNILVQAIAMGRIGGLEQAREISRNSSQVNQYEPMDSEAWEEACVRFDELTAK